jgi:hypothetical protein
LGSHPKRQSLIRLLRIVLQRFDTMEVAS